MAVPLLSSQPLCFMLQMITKRVMYCPNLMVSKLAVLVPPPRPEKPVHLPIAELVKVSLQGASFLLRVLSCREWHGPLPAGMCLGYWTTERLHIQDACLCMCVP